MANKAWNDIDTNYEALGQPVYCAFLDILGYRNKMDAYYDGSLNLVGRIRRALKPVETINIIMDKGGTGRVGRHVRHLSDSIVLTYPQTPAGLSNLLHDAAVVADHMAMDELFIRGGIAAGLHFDGEIDGIPMLVSSALRKAHRLEETANVPRILVDPDLVRLLTLEDQRYVVRQGDDLIVHFLTRFEGGDNALSNLKKEIVDIEKYGEDHKSEGSVPAKVDFLLDYYFWAIEGLDGSHTSERGSKNERGFRRFDE